MRDKVQILRELLALGKGGGDALALDAGSRRSRGLVAERVLGSRVLLQVKRDVVDGDAWCAVSLVDGSIGHGMSRGETCSPNGH